MKTRRGRTTTVSFVLLVLRGHVGRACRNFCAIVMREHPLLRTPTLYSSLVGDAFPAPSPKRGVNDSVGYRISIIGIHSDYSDSIPIEKKLIVFGTISIFHTCAFVQYRHEKARGWAEDGGPKHV